MTKNYIFHNAKELLEHCHNHKMSIWEVMVNYELQLSKKSKKEVLKMLGDRLKVIFDSIDAAVKNPEMSPSGMVGKSTPLLAKAVRDFKKWDKKLLLNEAATRAMLGAVATGENNARMGVILAFPTAGAAGVLPGVIYGAKHKLGLTKQQMLEMMLTASAIGVVIADRKSVV